MCAVVPSSPFLNPEQVDGVMDTSAHEFLVHVFNGGGIDKLIVFPSNVMRMYDPKLRRLGNK